MYLFRVGGVGSHWGPCFGHVEELLQKSGGWPEPLTAGLQNADQYALRACALLGAIAAPYMAGYHQGTDGLLGAIVCRLQSRVVERSERRIPLCAQSFRPSAPACQDEHWANAARRVLPWRSAGALRLFQGAQQLRHPTLQFFYPALQSFLGRPQLCHFLPKTRIFFNQLPHVPKSHSRLGAKQALAS